MTAELTHRNQAADWWRQAVIYQIYPRSFADGNGDGIGDLAGISARLGYLADLGVDAVWLSPFYPSPQHDAGYDVADYFDVDPSYGTLAEFEGLIERIHALGMRVVIDVVPNHTSSEHRWFKAALAAEPGSPERDRYHFVHSPESVPNNWGSLFGGSAWTRVDQLSGRAEDHDWWYLHMFDVHQPDLNWDNPAVHAEFERYLRFWLDRGVDGFRVDVAHAMVKADGLPDDDFGPDRFSWIAPGGDGTARKAPDVGPNFDQDGVHDIFRTWRAILDEYGPDKMMVAEAWVEDPDRLANYVRADEMNHAFNFAVLKAGWKAAEFRAKVMSWYMANEVVGATSTWVLSNHDVVRHATRFGYPYGVDTSEGIGATDPQPDAARGLERATALTSFLLALPGSVYLYNGEELGLPESTTMPDEARQDPTWERSAHRVRGRDGCRVPLPWTASAANAGFGAGVPWLPQPEGWADFAVDVQEKEPNSVLSQYRHLIALRHRLGLGAGSLQAVDVHPDVVAVCNGDLLVAVNMGPVPLRIPVAGTLVQRSGTVVPDADSVRAAAAGELLLEPNRCVWVLPKH